MPPRLENLHWRWLALALVPAFASYYGRALRWAVFLRPLKARPSIMNLFGATVIGFAAITLFGRPGEFVRPYLIARKEQVPVPSQLAAWVLERMFDLLMALAVFGFALTRIHAATVRVGPNLTWVLAVGGRIVVSPVLYRAGACLLAMRHFAEPLRHWLLRAFRFLPERHFLKCERLITAFVQGVESTRSDGALLLILLYSIAEWVLIAGCFWCVAQAYVGTINLTFVDVIIFMGFVAFGSTVQIPGIGGGAQVVAVLVLTELFGAKLELATSFAIFIWIISFVVVVPVGADLGAERGFELAEAARSGPGGLPMKCPFCNHLHDKVVDSRESKEGDAIRRRRECLSCERRFTTYERIDEVPYMVVKKDGRREKFDRQKVLGGLLKACEKRPVSMSKLSELVNRVESKVSDSPDREISTIDIGEFLMDSLRELDKIAYVRFASVYRDFQDEQAFFNELKNLMRQKLT